MDDFLARHRAHSFAVRAVVVLVVLAAVAAVATFVTRDRERGHRSLRAVPAAGPTTSPTPSPPGEAPTPTPSPTPSPANDPVPSATPTDTEPPAPPASATPAPTRRATAASVRCGTGTLWTTDEITGIVVDEAGRPMSGMEIWGAGCAGDVTDADGRFAVPCRHDAYGLWGVATPFRWHGGVPQRLASDAVGFGWIGEPLQMVKCGTTHRVVLRRPATVEVRVVDARWAPVDDVAFTLYVGYSEGGEYVVRGRTDSAGVFRVRALAPGTYTAYGTRNGRPLRATLTVAAGETETATLTTRGATAPPSPTPSPSPTAEATTVPPAG